MAKLQVVAWKADFVGFTAWDSHANSEVKKRLRQAINASPDELRRIKIAIRSRKPFTLPNVRETHIQSLRQILETMGAEVVVSNVTNPHY